MDRQATNSNHASCIAFVSISLIFYYQLMSALNFILTTAITACSPEETSGSPKKIPNGVP